MREEQKLRNVDITSALQLAGIQMDTSTLSKIERGATNPPIEVIMALPKILHCDFNALFYEEEGGTKEQQEPEEFAGQ